uniref:cytochrome-c oxidase n=1 Tax=Dielis plumipes fossulana TaxID=2977626 RepID=A0A1W5WXD9_9HYME|nr:cytochrome c oxidase subunit IIb [Dielis plumipes fossulana]
MCFRLLDTDRRMVVPINNPIRILTSSLDVIHSFAIPSMGVKVDSIPGRLNQSFLYCQQMGVFFGQCSEICGLNHSYMPFCIEVTNYENFLEWFKKVGKKY